MPKFMIIDGNGNIVRTIALPYEGTLIDISDMPDVEWEGWFTKLHQVKVEMSAPGRHNKDARGLPKIVAK